MAVIQKVEALRRMSVIFHQKPQLLIATQLQFELLMGRRKGIPKIGKKTTYPGRRNQMAMRTTEKTRSR